MKNQTSTFYTSLFLFALGALSGLTLTVFATWADLEAAYYGFARRAGAGLSGLSCPMLMTDNEINVISLQVKNSLDQKRSPAVRVEISSPMLAFEYQEALELQPGEKTTLRWEVGPENIDLHRFIFAKVLVYSFYPTPDREGTCGVYILPLPGQGSFFVWGMVGFSLLGMGLGLLGIKQVNGPEQSGATFTKQMSFMAGIVLLGILTAFMGWWVQGILLLVVSVLISVIAAGLMLNRSEL